MHARLNLVVRQRAGEVLLVGEHEQRLRRARMQCERAGLPVRARAGAPTLPASEASSKSRMSTSDASSIRRRSVASMTKMSDSTLP